MKTFAESKTQKEKDRERQKRRRSQLSQQELEIQRAKDREAKRLSRAKETSEQKKLRRQKDRETHRLYRAHQSYDQKQARLKRERELRRRARAQEKLALAHNWVKLKIPVPPNDMIETKDNLDDQSMTVPIVKQEVLEIEEDLTYSMFENGDYSPPEENANLCYKNC